jgi:hypothetical protein
MRAEAAQEMERRAAAARAAAKRGGVDASMLQADNLIDAVAVGENLETMLKAGQTPLSISFCCPPPSWSIMVPCWEQSAVGNPKLQLIQDLRVSDIRTANCMLCGQYAPIGCCPLTCSYPPPPPPPTIHRRRGSQGRQESPVFISRFEAQEGCCKVTGLNSFTNQRCCGLIGS